MADDKHAQAVDTFARGVVAAVVRAARDDLDRLRDDRDPSSEIGDRSWQAIDAALESHCQATEPSRAAYDAAFDFLAGWHRAWIDAHKSGTETTHG